MTEAGQGSCQMNFILGVFDYNGGVICLAFRIDTINVNWGGKEACSRQVCHHCFCARCAACQFARAVKKAKELGLDKRTTSLAVSHSGGGAPANSAMER